MTDEHQDVFERGTDGPRVVLAGVDGSESSWRAAAYAAGLARRQNSTLALVYIQPYMAASVAAGVNAAALTEELAEEVAGEIRKATENLQALGGVRWAFHTFRDDPYNGLVTAARDLKADTVVVGASESAGHRLIGSMAVRLVKRGLWPVTVVP
ncbi:MULTISPECIES: universal stress protein [unclassified Streptomyces]|uniref:universal stress protein n=1 Tax=unclassified Streptomyces TaxID=2593676 RepID=UPI0013BC4AA2|nr:MULTISPECIES: universal stress protein [unclassified Streptomyces]NEB28425.1 universal stress protein [Streptomyces sp. SID14446]MCX4912170.1 universal stress protein [Streptomyces sp. NBC_00687]MCX5285445.1 universal stress protein [Streptomyces sp. NBC_00198]WSD82288.1 universal stress protein [Streptomyces sp. NBC_01558]WSK65569.1 universal stress protein [Streptomyces sp. NBC_01281]